MINDLKVIELEINSYCNRVCAWCPNISFNRNFSESLPLSTYTKLLEELRDNGFTGIISYSRYNEPFADFGLLQSYTNKAKELLPTTLLVTNTNGDYLTKEKIINSNIDEITIMDYDSLGYTYCMNQLLSWDAVIESIDQNIIYATIGDIKLAYCSDWKENSELQDRGGFFNQDIIDMLFKNNRTVRDYVCNEPNSLIAIDYTGNIMPCCNLRSDNPNHEDYILGSIITETLNNILSKEETLSLFDVIHNNTGLDLPVPCQYCHKETGRYLRDIPSIYFDNIEDGIE